MLHEQHLKNSAKETHHITLDSMRQTLSDRAQSGDCINNTVGMGIAHAALDGNNVAI